MYNKRVYNKHPFRLWFQCITLLLTSGLLGNLVFADDEIKGLDLKADQATTNLSTAESKLSGNVILKHHGFQITGDRAEVRTNGENEAEAYIIAGSPAVFYQSIDSSTNQSTMRVKAGWLNYQPLAEKLHFKKNVEISSQFKNGQFLITASDIMLKLYLEKPSILEASGSPLIFSHQVSSRDIKIEASRINWDSDADIATLYLAKVIDNKVVFSADEIIYNFKTGELSAIGEGDSRPNYRFDPKK